MYSNPNSNDTKSPINKNNSIGHFLYKIVTHVYVLKNDIWIIFIK